MEEFTKDRYGADVLKVEVPVNMKFVEGTQAFAGEKAYYASGSDGPRSGAPRKSRRSRSSTCLPASATPSSPRRWSWPARPGTRFSGRPVRPRDVEGRYRGVREAGWDGLPGVAGRSGVKNIENVNAKLKTAQPWFEFYGAKSADELASK